MNPADEYVADFVSGISRFKVIRANAIMVDVQTYEQENGAIPKEIKTFNEAEKLGSILKYAADTNKIIGIIDEDSEENFDEEIHDDQDEVSDNNELETNPEDN